ncbi:MAG: hypothetical protein BalsKO_28000 [Balneolaceae bacterium]
MAKNTMKYFLLFLFSIAIYGCSKNTPTNEPESTSTPNILLIIADDMGKDATSGYPEGSVKPITPNLNMIKNTGLIFNNFWANPVCSPTRASIITGKYGLRTGVKNAGDILSTTEKTLQQYIKEETNSAYSSAIIGKWHLSAGGAGVNPEDFGIDYYSGLIRGSVQDYYNWDLTENGSSTSQAEYTSKVFTDLSIDWVSAQSKPWFLWLAYNAPHTPFHTPPVEMHSQGNLPDYSDELDPIPYYMAAIEAMDYQIGRLLEAIPDDELENTIIIFMGDNGSPNQVAQAPYSPRKVKSSLYQGGVNVPMFISGYGVSRTGQDHSLITSTDLFSTIAQIAGVNIPKINDSKSFIGLLNESSQHRDFQYSEIDDGENNLWAISNGEFKLLVNENGQEEMYDLSSDPYETKNLLLGNLSSAQSNAKSILETELVIIRN